MRRRLVLVTLASTTMIALAFVLPLAVLVRDVAEERALTRGRQVVATLGPVLLSPDREALEVALSAVDPGIPTSVVLPGGDRLGAPVPPAVDLEAARGGAATVVRTETADLLVTPVVRPDAGTAVVVAAVPHDLQRRGVAAAWTVLGLLAVVLVGGAVVLADRLGRSVTRPAADVVATARRLGAGDLRARVQPEGPREVADIATALNQLADRIDVLVHAEREAVADLSHRLRTPLTAMRLDAEALPPGADRDRLVADVDALERSVDRLIRDARTGADAAGGVGRCDLVPLVRERASWWGALAEDQDRTATLAVEVDAALVAVSRGDLEDAVDALLGNVFAHTPEGTAYAIEVIVPATGTVEVVVQDHGPGLPAGLGRARGESGSGSTGLGLDIADRVARSAGGRLDLSTDADGARAALVLPTIDPNGQAVSPGAVGTLGA